MNILIVVYELKKLLILTIFMYTSVYFKEKEREVGHVVIFISFILKIEA